MEVKWLETFAAAARAGRMSVAAEELGYARSTATYHVQALERAMGTTLFDRDAPGRPLTPAGEMLLEHTLVILDRLALAKAQIAAIPNATTPQHVHAITGQRTGRTHPLTRAPQTFNHSVHNGTRRTTSFPRGASS